VLVNPKTGMSSSTSGIRNIAERIFGVMKRRWKIIRETNSFDLRTNAKIVAALAALHNFIRQHDIEDLMDPWEVDDDGGGGGANVQQIGTEAATQQAAALREPIANDMWSDYRSVIDAHNANRRRQAQRRRNAQRQCQSHSG